MGERFMDMLVITPCDKKFKINFILHLTSYWILSTAALKTVGTAKYKIIIKRSQ